MSMDMYNVYTLYIYICVHIFGGSQVSIVKSWRRRSMSMSSGEVGGGGRGSEGEVGGGGERE